ncbi:phage holin family protein [Kluyvera genomosp. 3]|nr:phage holin family protein [Kluyvera genomosp. 3]
MLGLLDKINYAVVFGSFAGSVFYAATATNITRCRLMAHFVTSFIVGVLGAQFIGARLALWTGYSETPLDALGAVLLSALIIKTLTFLNSQELLHIIRLITRHTHDGGYSRKK